MYLTTSEVMAGLETNALIKGVIRINQRNYKEAYINSPVGLPTHWILLLLLAVQSIMNYGFFCYYLPLIQILWFLPPILNVHYLQIFHWIQLPSNRYAYLASALGFRECYTLSSKDLKIPKYCPSTQTLNFLVLKFTTHFDVFALPHVSTVNREFGGSHSGDWKKIISGMWQCAAWWICRTDVEDPATSIINVTSSKRSVHNCQAK
jgi:hypothetical protein